jgi:hypothetical protein
MKLMLKGIVAVALLTVAGSAATLGTLKAKSRVYGSEMRRVFDQPLFLLEKGEVVEVVRWGKTLAFVKATNGRSGWLEKVAIDTTLRPPILGLDSSAVRSKPLDAQEDSALKQAWIEAQSPKTTEVSVVPQKQLDLLSDTAHITPRHTTDSAAQ